MAQTTMARPADLDDEIVIPTVPMTYEEYVAWTERGDGHRGEWVDGEVIIFVSTTPWHGQVAGFLLMLLGNYLDLRRIGLIYPQEVELRVRDGAAREPDLFVVLNEHRHRITDRRVEGAADLVIEIISPDSVTRDRKVKFDEYEAAGVTEYWIVDPREGKERIDGFRLGEGGAYEAIPADGEGRMRSSVLPGVWLDPAWLTAEELPSVVRLGMEMAGEG